MEFDLSDIEFSYQDIKRGLKLPKRPSKELAEFIGILAGDGHISFNIDKYRVNISGNSISDYKYLTNYTNKLIYHLFNLNIRIHKRKNKNAIAIILSSKGVVSFMKEIGYYKHIVDIKIPDWIKDNQTYAPPFLRGLIDTDGCVFVSDKKGAPHYPCIELTTVCFDLANVTRNFLKKLGFNVVKIRSYKYSHSNNYSYKVSLYGYDNLTKWIEEIGFSNQYKSSKALKYKNGTCGI